MSVLEEMGLVVDETTTVRFHSRGCGNNWLPCFICGYIPPSGGCQADLAAFINSREDGNRIIMMFDQLGIGLVTLDERRAREGRYQIKVGACGEHEPNLLLLSEIPHYTRGPEGSDDGRAGWINIATIKRCLPGEKKP